MTPARASGRVLSLATAVVLTVAGCQGPGEEEAQEPSPTAAPTTAPIEEPADLTELPPQGTKASPSQTLPVREGRVIFDVYSFLCGERLGTETRSLRPDGFFCEASISVMNATGRAVTIDPFASTLHTDGGSFGPWRRAMEIVVLSSRHSLFGEPIPADGGGTASLIYEIPEGVRPVSLELHVAAGSRGTVVDVENCALLLGGNPNECALLTRGSQPGVAYPAKADVAVSYPATFEFGTPRSICFDTREWELSPDRPAPSLERLDGNGVIALESRNLARFRDNAGATVWLVPSAANESDPAICG